MIGNLTKGNEFGPLLRYLFRRTPSGMERATLLGGTLAGDSIPELQRELKAISSLRGNARKPVRHLSVSLRPGEHLSMEDWLLVAQQVVREMGWDSYCVVQHHDQPHEHIHIVASRIRADGSLAREVLRDFRKVEGVLRCLEEQFGLEPVSSPTRLGRIHQNVNQNPTRPRGRERALAERTGAPTLKQRIRLVVDQSIEAANRCRGVRPFPRFLEEVRMRGGNASLNIRGSRLTGITFEFEGEVMKGSDLGKPYGFANLAKALNYDPTFDLMTVSPETVIDRTRQHIRSTTDEATGNHVTAWSSRATRITGSDPELGGRMVELVPAGAMEPFPGVGDLEGRSNGYDARGKGNDLENMGGLRTDPRMGEFGGPNAKGINLPGSTEATSLFGRAPDFCGGNSDGPDLGRGPSRGLAQILGESPGLNSGLSDRRGRDTPASSFDHHIAGRQRPIALEASQALGLGSALSSRGLPPLPTGSLRALAAEYLPKLTEWFALRTCLKLSPEPEKSLIQANDDSWSMPLDPCFPEELPAQVEKLAETSLAHGSHEDRDEAYWAADDAIREAYTLTANDSLSSRAGGFEGWIENRLDLVCSGWKRLVELSKGMAKKFGNPVAAVEGEEQNEDRPPIGSRWSRIGRLELDLNERQADVAAEIQRSHGTTGHHQPPSKDTLG